MDFLLYYSTNISLMGLLISLIWIETSLCFMGSLAILLCLWISVVCGLSGGVRFLCLCCARIPILKIGYVLLFGVWMYNFLVQLISLILSWFHAIFPFSLYKYCLFKVDFSNGLGYWILIQDFIYLDSCFYCKYWA